MRSSPPGFPETGIRADGNDRFNVAVPGDDVGPGEVSRFHDRYHGITITVLGPSADGYRVWIIRARVPHRAPSS